MEWSPEVDPHKYGPGIVDKVTKAVQRWNNDLLNGRWWNDQAYHKPPPNAPREKNLDPYFTPYKKN